MVKFRKMDNAAYSQKIIDFLKQHPIISVRGLERQLKIPLDTIRKAKEGRQNISSKHFEVITKALEPYGFRNNLN